MGHQSFFLKEESILTSVSTIPDTDAPTPHQSILLIFSRQSPVTGFNGNKKTSRTRHSAANTAGTQNTNLHPSWYLELTRLAAANGPTVAPAPIATLIMPWYLPRSFRLTRSLTMMATRLLIPPPPTPDSALAAYSHVGVRAKPHSKPPRKVYVQRQYCLLKRNYAHIYSSLPSTVQDTEISNTGFLPTTSDSRP